MFGLKAENPYEDIVGYIERASEAIADANMELYNSHVHNDDLGWMLHTITTGLHEAYVTAVSHTKQWEEEESDKCQ
jgi:hypothetical protein